MNTKHSYRSYYRTDKYKGFYRVRNGNNRYSRLTRLTFTNGETTIYTTGIYPEDAMAKAFMAIDRYHARKQVSGNDGFSTLQLQRVAANVN